MMNVVIPQNMEDGWGQLRIVNGEAVVIPKGHKVVKNLLSGKDVIIEENCPLCCDPSSETYHSM